MSAPVRPTRRSIISAIAGLPVGGAALASVRSPEMVRTGSNALVAYFTRSGNTRVVAGLIHRTLDTDLFEICPAQPYPADYLETVEQARQERDSGYEPPLAATVPDMASYETVFLGFPIWGETAPPVIRSFLSAHDLAGKTLVPFVTHGGYGLGNSRSVLSRHAENARLLEGFALQADQERDTMERVQEWLGKRERGE